MSRSYWVIGPGRVGIAIGAALADAGAASTVLFVGRRERAPDHPVMASPVASYTTQPPGPPPAGTRVLLAVPDGAIGESAAAIAALGEPGDGCVAIHFSGAQTAEEVLAPLKRRGVATGSLHPLQSIADPDQGAARLAEAFFTFEGDASARSAAAAIVEAVGGRMLEVHPADKPRYHAACVFASNYVVACSAVATRLLAEAVHITRDEAARALQPLWRGAVANLDEAGLPRALTGPVARGDVETVKRHLAVLDEDTRRLYSELGLRALDLSRELGLKGEAAEAIEAELRGAGAGGKDG